MICSSIRDLSFRCWVMSKIHSDNCFRLVNLSQLGLESDNAASRTQR